MSLRVIFLVYSLIFINCNNNYSDDDLSIFKYNESAGINTLDPAFAKDQATIWATNQLFNGLVQLDSNLVVNPSVAKSWDLSSDALDYTFCLRDDVFFHDHKLFDGGIGRKVVASDFEYSFKRLLDSRLAAPGSWVLSKSKKNR